MYKMLEFYEQHRLPFYKNGKDISLEILRINDLG